MKKGHKNFFHTINFFNSIQKNFFHLYQKNGIRKKTNSPTTQPTNNPIHSKKPFTNQQKKKTFLFLKKQDTEILQKHRVYADRN